MPRRVKRIRTTDPFQKELQKLQEVGGRLLSQSELAERLGVNRSQLSAWLRGTEKPTAQSLIHLAEKASNHDSRRLFLGWAGINLERIEEELRERLQANVPGLGESDTTADLPLISGFGFGSEPTAPKLSVTYRGNLKIPGGFLRPGSTVAFQIPVPGKVTFGKLPAPLRAGDLVFIDRSYTRPEDFIQGTGIRIAALVLSSIPEQLEGVPVSQEILDRIASGSSVITMERKEEDDSFNPQMFSILEEMNEPRLLFGYLEAEKAPGYVEEELADRNEGRNHWRHSFRAGGLKLPLNAWSKGWPVNEVQPHQIYRRQLIGTRGPEQLESGPKHAELLGALVGWVSKSAKKS